MRLWTKPVEVYEKWIKTAIQGWILIGKPLLKDNNMIFKAAFYL